MAAAGPLAASVEAAVGGAAAAVLAGGWARVAFAGVVLLAQDVVINKGVLATFSAWGRIVKRGKHLDELEAVDRCFINFNRLTTCVFTFHLLQLVASAPHVERRLSEATLANTLGAVAALFVVYDMFYYCLHCFLHVRGIYRHVHKHHHRQMCPSRGNVDAINVHPFEFVSGEYLHLLAVYLVPCHALAVLAFVLMGGVLASLNHTRYDVKLPFGLYRVQWHDVHHRLPQSNYSQYTMLWDVLFGSYTPFYDNKAVDYD